LDPCLLELGEVACGPQMVGSTSSFILRPARNSANPCSTTPLNGIVTTHPVVWWWRCGIRAITAR
jgi:hypothetical protein